MFRDKLERLRLRALFSLLGGALLIAVCGFAAFLSIRIARADWLASVDTMSGFERAVRVMPDEPELLARAALYRSDNDEDAAGLDGDLERAARLNPLNSALMMTLGLREEFRGNQAKAEAWLVRAAEIDHQFKPAWTLANYYYRSNRPEKSWPMIQRILNLEPLGFDPGPVFALCWNLAKDDANAKILRLMPRRGPRPIQYLAFLMSSHRTETALDVWPEALAAADPADASDAGTLAQFADYLAGVDRASDAVNVWNQLVDRGLIRSGRLDPAKGVSIADPDFRFVPDSGAPAVQAFGWRALEVPGVFTSRLPGVMRFEINGDEPEAFTILSVFAPVSADARYRLQWNVDASELSAPRDPGFRFQIVQGSTTARCQPLLAPGKPAGCEFATPPDGKTGQVGRVRIDLGYTRALGTTRVSGVLELLGVRLEIAK